MREAIGELLLRDFEGDGIMGIIVPIDIQILDFPIPPESCS